MDTRSSVWHNFATFSSKKWFIFAQRCVCFSNVLVNSILQSYWITFNGSLHWENSWSAFWKSDIKLFSICNKMVPISREWPSSQLLFVDNYPVLGIHETGPRCPNSVTIKHLEIKESKTNKASLHRAHTHTLTHRHRHTHTPYSSSPPPPPLPPAPVRPATVLSTQNMK